MPPPLAVRRGAVVQVDLNPTQGREQRGMRPCVVVSIDALRPGTIIVVPVTGTHRDWPHHIELKAGNGGLQKDSVAMCDQVRAISESRITRVYGHLAGHQTDEIARMVATLIGA